MKGPKVTKKIECILSSMETTDWGAVCSIYSEGIQSGQATFETEAPNWEKWHSSHLPHCRLVARVGETVAGWAALSRFSSRSVYSGVAEVSLYVDTNFRGRGIGRALLNELIACSEQNGIWTLQAGIFPENDSSLALHKTCGFREVGRRERIAELNGVWRDVVVLERRSRVVGEK